MCLVDKLRATKVTGVARRDGKWCRKCTEQTSVIKEGMSNRRVMALQKSTHRRTHHPIQFVQNIVNGIWFGNHTFEAIVLVIRHDWIV